MSMKPQATSISDSTYSAGTASRQVEHVLFAISPREWDMFLPAFRPEDIAGACTFAIVDPETTSTEAWEQVLRDERPTVLVSAWSAKKIPMDWILSEDFSLRYVCHITGSLKSVMSPALFDAGVRASNWGGVINHTVAEHGILMVLALLRGANGWPESIRQGGWTVDHSRRLRTRALRGKQIGLHGFGAIAREVVAMLAPFRPKRVSAWSHGVPHEYITKHGVHPCAGLRELFSENDIVICCESLTPENRGAIDATVLSSLKDDGIFINIGRAAIVDETALMTEVESGRLRMGVDVFHKEPLRPDTPFLGRPHVLASPHIAGPTDDTYAVCGDHALENLRRYIANEPLDGEVDLAGFARMT